MPPTAGSTLGSCELRARWTSNSDAGGLTGKWPAVDVDLTVRMRESFIDWSTEGFRQWAGRFLVKQLSIEKDGQRGDFHADPALYYCDPDYEWRPLNQVRVTLKEALESARISIRVMADLLDTSPSQVVRLLEETKMPRQLERLASIAGYSLKVELKKAN